MTRTEAECADIGGIYYGDGTVECPPESPCSIYGACCQPITGTCSIDNEPGCFNGGVNSGIWKGEGTDCLDNDFNGSPDICEATCPADLDTDGDVGIVDFLILLSQWGPCE